MIIRAATILDAAQIASVHILSWQTIYKDHIPKNVLNDLSKERRSAEWHERLAQDVKVWVIEKEKFILGFVSICPTRDDDSDPNKVMEISAIYLLHEYWGKGLGKQLCEIVFDYTLQNKFKEVTLWVLEKNIQARHFYESLGFHLTGNTKTDHIGCEKLSVIRYRKILSSS